MQHQFSMNIDISIHAHKSPVKRMSQRPRTLHTTHGSHAYVSFDGYLLQIRFLLDHAPVCAQLHCNSCFDAHPQLGMLTALQHSMQS